MTPLVRCQLLEKRKKLELSQTMARNWRSESGKVQIPGLDGDFKSPTPTPSTDTKSDLSAASEAVNKILDENDYEDSDEEKSAAETAAVPPANTWSSSEPRGEDTRVKRSRWGGSGEEAAGAKRSRWGGDSGDSASSGSFVNQGGEDSLDIGQMRRRPGPWSGPARRGLLVPPPGRGRGAEAGFRGRGGGLQQFQQQHNPHANSKQHQLQRLRSASSGQQPDYGRFWAPAEVTDYARRPEPEPEFRPKTFDYSHGAARGGGGHSGSSR